MPLILQGMQVAVFDQGGVALCKSKGDKLALCAVKNIDSSRDAADIVVPPLVNQTRVPSRASIAFGKQRVWSVINNSRRFSGASRMGELPSLVDLSTKGLGSL